MFDSRRREEEDKAAFSGGGVPMKRGKKRAAGPSVLTPEEIRDKASKIFAAKGPGR